MPRRPTARRSPGRRWSLRRPRRRRRRRRPPRLGKGGWRAVRRRRQVVAGAGEILLGGYDRRRRAARRAEQPRLQLGVHGAEESAACSLIVLSKSLLSRSFFGRAGWRPNAASWYRGRARPRSQAFGRRDAIGDELSAVARATSGAIVLPTYAKEDLPSPIMPCWRAALGGSMYPGESRLSATYPAPAARRVIEPKSPVAAAHRLAELERSPTVKSIARHDSLLDLRRSRPNDVPSRWEGGSGAQPPCRPWIEAAGLRAVEELAGVFKQVTAAASAQRGRRAPEARRARGQSRIKQHCARVVHYSSGCGPAVSTRSSAAMSCPCCPRCRQRRRRRSSRGSSSARA